MHYINMELETSERFDMAKFLDFADDGVFDCLNSYMLSQIPRLPASGIYRISKEVGRPDLLSYNLYRDTQYWWIILVYNGLSSVKQLKSGKIIAYPSLSSIEQLYMNASINNKVK